MSGAHNYSDAKDSDELFIHKTKQNENTSEKALSFSEMMVLHMEALVVCKGCLLVFGTAKIC